MEHNNRIVLTEREKEVVSLALKGLTNTEIAGHLKISAHTVKAYIERIYRKFNVHNRVQMTVYAMQNRLGL